MNVHYPHFNNIARVESSERLMMVPRTSAKNRCLKESEVGHVGHSWRQGHCFCIQATSVEEDAAYHNKPVA